MTFEVLHAEAPPIWRGFLFWDGFSRTHRKFEVRHGAFRHKYYLMFDFLGKTVAKIFGSKSERDLKEITPYVALINAEYAKLAGLTDDQLREQTDAVRARIAERLAGLDGQIAGLHQQIDTQLQLDVAQKEVLFEQIDALEKQRNKDLEAVLLEVLPAAFAIVKDTARRYKENGQLVVTANARDREYAATHANCQIVGDQAIWANKWLAAGAEIVWDMVHYDVQLMGGGRNDTSSLIRRLRR